MSSVNKMLNKLRELNLRKENHSAQPVMLGETKVAQIHIVATHSYKVIYWKFNLKGLTDGNDSFIWLP